MTRSKLGLLGLCAMLLGLMAFGTAGAQATAGSNWLILTSGGAVKTGAELHAALGLEAETLLVLHSENLKIKFLFECKKVKAVNAFLQKDGTIAKEYNGKGEPVGSQVLFSECITKLNGVEEPKCIPTDPTDGAGFIVTKAGHALLVLGTSGEKLTKIIPDEGETFATVVTGSKCAIGSSVPVIGTLNLKDCEGLGDKHLVRHLVEEGPGSELFTISKTTEHKATLLGSAWALLTGEHEKLLFGGDWA